MKRQIKTIRLVPDGEETILGIELGSTRIKAILTDKEHNPIAFGSHVWENQLHNGIWTYSMDAVWNGLQSCYRDMAADFKARYGQTIRKLGAIGFSGMMHGYLPFDGCKTQLAPFRTWRNTTADQAANELTGLFGFNIPQRWSIAHLHQAILDEESHVPQIRYLTTLAGYVHWRLTGERVLGVGEASGMFPIDSQTGTYDAAMVEKFEAHIAEKQLPWKLRDILPRVLSAGAYAGQLTREGALLLDPAGDLVPGIPLCPPEGDAGTGMVATNAVAPRMGNVSAGTSVFAMIVLERGLTHVYPEIDMVTTPDGSPVAMVHCNNCTSEVNVWVSLFHELLESAGATACDLYPLLFRKALEGEPDCGGILCCNYLSGEPIAGMLEGRPLLVRRPDSRLNLGNFMRAQVYSAVATLRMGMDVLFEKERIRLDRLMGHGGLFKTPDVGQGVLAAAVGVPVSVMETAGEGGAWGIALLAGYMMHREEGQTLSAYLTDRVFANMPLSTIEPDAEDQKGFALYMQGYHKMLAVEAAAIQAL